MMNKAVFAALLAALVSACDYVGGRAQSSQRTDAAYRAAMEDYRAGRLDQAIAGFRKVCRDDPSNSSARFQLACLLLDGHVHAIRVPVQVLAQPLVIGQYVRGVKPHCLGRSQHLQASIPFPAIRGVLLLHVVRPLARWSKAQADVHRDLQAPPRPPRGSASPVRGKASRIPSIPQGLATLAPPF